MELTDKHKKIIWEAWQSYDCSMSDGWRNDFYEDGQAADEWRREYMFDSIREQIPEISDDEIEKQIDSIR